MVFLIIESNMELFQIGLCEKKNNMINMDKTCFAVFSNKNIDFAAIHSFYIFQLLIGSPTEKRYDG